MASKVILRCDTLNLALSDKTKGSYNFEVKTVPQYVVVRNEKGAIFSVPVH